MARFWTLILPVTLIVGLPVVAAAQSTQVYRWASEYKPLSGSSVRTINLLDERDEARGIPLGFTYRIDNGEAYDTVNIGAKGYVTFGEGRANRPNPRAPGAGGEPKNFIAAWWGDHVCHGRENGRPASVRYQPITQDGQRYFVIEWANCRKNYPANDEKAAIFSAQLWLAEGPQQHFRVIFGEFTPPADAGGDWNNARFGFEMEQGQNRPAFWKFGNNCSAPASGGCRGTDFPEGYTYQILPWMGRPDITGTLQVDRQSLTVSGQQVSVDVSGTTMNIGTLDAENVRREYYLSETREVDSNSILIGQDPVIPVVQGMANADFERKLSFNLSQLPNFGQYYVCVRHQVQPEQGDLNQQDYLRKLDADSSNDVVCEHQSALPLSIGPDLTGSITLNTLSGKLLGTANVTATIRNNGNVQISGPIRYWVHWVPNTENLRPLMRATDGGQRYTFYWGSEADPVPSMRVDGRNWDYENDPWNFHIFEGVYNGTLNANSGNISLGSFNVKIPRFMESMIQGEDRGKWHAVLEIATEWPAQAGQDPRKDANPDNNVVASSQRISLQLPRLFIDASSPSTFVEMTHSPHTDPNACVYGERITASILACNEGSEPAVGFHPAVLLGGPSNAAPDEAPWAASLFKSCSPEVAEAQRKTPQEVCGDPSESICHQALCRKRCQTDADCQTPQDPPGLYCEVDLDFTGAEVRTCVTKLNPGSCQVYRFDAGSLPFERPGRDDEMEPFEHGEELVLWAMLDPTNRVVDEAGLAQQHPLTSMDEPMYCYLPLEEYVAHYLDAPQVLVAGDTYRLRRVIHNIGFRSSSGRDGVRYGYYLSATPHVSENQWLLPVQGTSDGLAVEYSLTRRQGSVHGISDKSDLVMIPEYIPPGKRYLGLVIDPLHSIDEYDKTNNVVVVEVDVQPPVLQIRTQALPVARVGLRYHWALWASGGVGRYSWSAEGLPEWLNLSSDGVLEGIPPEAGDHVFVLAVRSGDMTVYKPLSLRVRHTEGPLTAEMDVLPPAVRGADYEVYLTASGGVPPYQWSLSEGRLPTGLVLDPSGKISGRVSETAASQTMTFQVEDRLGAVATRTATILAVRDAHLRISGNLTAGVTGSPMSRSCLVAEGGDASGDYEWTVEEASLPAGVRVTEGIMPNQSQICFEGEPAACGLFLVNVEVRDAQGQRSSASFPLDIQCGQLTLNDVELRPLRRGEQLDVDLRARGFDQVRMSLYSGTLPAGITLSEQGRLYGQVADDADFGTYNFVVEMEEEGGRYGLAPLALVVLPEKKSAPKDEGGGCSSTGNSGSFALSLGAVLLGLLGLGRRRPVRVPVRLRSLGGRRSLPLLALVAMLGSGAMACGGSDDGDSLCPKNACADIPNTTCDPADGLCKCGSEGSELVCKTGEVCVDDVSPRCVSTLCEGVFCDGGQTCDPADGVCKCGGDTCGAGEVCYLNRCEPEQNCKGVVCGSGTACDPTDGQCKCDGEVCGPGERCDSGVCVADPCSGLHCGPNTVCNPTDGLCHCGGVTGNICEPGQGCVLEDGVYRCTNIDLCKDVECVGRTVCDPLTGSCRCGGIAPEFPICQPDQVCQDGECVGGELCTGVVCDTGFTCDPLDGLCKCGGERGQVCAANETCMPIEGQYRCSQRCDLIDQDCPSGQGCYFDPSTGNPTPFCTEGGANPDGSTCEEQLDCAAGNLCYKGTCRELCDPERGNSTCSGTALCAPIEIQGLPDELKDLSVGVCVDV